MDGQKAATLTFRFRFSSVLTSDHSNSLPHKGWICASQQSIRLDHQPFPRRASMAAVFLISEAVKPFGRSDEKT